MQPVIDPGDVIFIKKININDLKVGDVITFKKDSFIATHRIIEIQEDKVITQGDNNNISYDENNNKISEWPGVIMENEGGGLYSYTLNLPEEWGNTTRVIFNDNKNQIPDSGGNGFELKEGEKKIYKDEQWSDYEIKINQPTGDVSVIENTAVVKNPDNNIKVNYDDVIVKNQSNLTSRIKLSLDFYAIKEGGSQEDTTIPPIVDDNINTTIPEGAKAFEVLVGDIDNLNLGYKKSIFSYISGYD